MSNTAVDPRFAAELAAEHGSDLRIVSAEDWQTITQAMGIVKGLPSRFDIDPQLVRRINAVRVTTLRLDMHEGHDPQHMDPRQTCEHGWLAWQSCPECGQTACPSRPETRYEGRPS